MSAISLTNLQEGEGKPHAYAIAFHLISTIIVQAYEGELNIGQAYIITLVVTSRGAR